MPNGIDKISIEHKEAISSNYGLLCMLVFLKNHFIWQKQKKVNVDKRVESWLSICPAAATAAAFVLFNKLCKTRTCSSNELMYALRGSEFALTLSFPCHQLTFMFLGWTVPFARAGTLLKAL